MVDILQHKKFIKKTQYILNITTQKHKDTPWSKSVNVSFKVHHALSGLRWPVSSQHGAGASMSSSCTSMHKTIHKNSFLVLAIIFYTDHILIFKIVHSNQNWGFLVRIQDFENGANFVYSKVQFVFHTCPIFRIFLQGMSGCAKQK